MNERDLEKEALQIRRRFLTMHFKAQAGHIGTGLSAIDLLIYLYRFWLGPSDRFILSKGHGASSLYATLHQVGLMSSEVLGTYYQDGSLLPAHPAARAHPGIPVATGSLGHGLSISTGLCYAYRLLSKSDARVACLLSDGECNEGSVWEAAMFASHHHLCNLVAIIDANGLQGFGTTTEVMNLEPLADKWESFGFRVREVDGHNFADIHSALREGPSDKPHCVIARTVKGKGVSFLEGRLDSHYLPLTQAQFEQAMTELDQAERGLELR